MQRPGSQLARSSSTTRVTCCLSGKPNLIPPSDNPQCRFDPLLRRIAIPEPQTAMAGHLSSVMVGRTPRGQSGMTSKRGICPGLHPTKPSQTRTASRPAFRMRLLQEMHHGIRTTTRSAATGADRAAVKRATHASQLQPQEGFRSDGAGAGSFFPFLLAQSSSFRTRIPML